jgi:Glycosyl transferase family 2
VTAPRLSIIINNYNYGRFLGDAIDSALAQTYPNLEVIVVDDGSTDHSRDVIAAAGDRIVPVLKPNGGQASAINAGFVHSTGDIILLLDADDTLLPTTCERVVAALVKQPDAAKCHYYLELMDAAGAPIGKLKPEQPLSSGDLRCSIIEHFEIRARHVWAVTSGSAFPRRVLERLLPIPEEPYRISADQYLAYLTPLLGPLLALDKPGARYRQHEANQYSQHAETRLTERSFARVRTDMLRKRETRAQQRRLAWELGLPFPEPGRDRWLNDARRRLISYKLDPTNHPVADDTLLRITWDGVYAILVSTHNRMARWPKRLLQAGWFAAVAAAPRPAAHWLIAQTCFSGSGGWFGRTVFRWRRRQIRAGGATAALRAPAHGRHAPPT